MSNDKQGQEQSQYINFAEKHGIIDSAFCQYFTSDEITSLEHLRNVGAIEYRIKVAEKMHSFKTVRFLVYQGRTTKIYCHLFSNDKCTSPLNTSEDKVCILK